MAKFYIATTLRNHFAHNLVRDLLVAKGHEITYDWTVHGPVWASGFEVLTETAHKEMQGVVDSDFVVVLLPGGNGTHTELGMALALGKPVFLFSSLSTDVFGAVPETCAFYHHSLVRSFQGMAYEDFVEEVCHRV